MIRLSTEARNLNWLVSNFVAGVPGVSEAAVVSSDGLLVAMSDGLDRVAADRLSAVAAGLQSIARGASARLGAGAVHEVIVEFEHAILFVMSISDTSVLAVTAYTSVRRRARRLRDGRPRGALRRRAHARARRGAPDLAPEVR